jgi:hypothetical protein
MQSAFADAPSDFRAIVAMFPNIPRHYLDDMIHSRLEVKTTARFIIDYSSIIAAKLRDAPITNDINKLIRGSDMYACIVVSFAALPVKF